MRWLADECVAAPLVVRLREFGHDVLFMAEVTTGANDVEVIQRAHHEGRLLLTEDKDFGELVFRRRHAVPGVVLLRIDTPAGALKWKQLSLAIDRYGDGLFGRHTVIEEERFRSRPIPSGT